MLTFRNLKSSLSVLMRHATDSINEHGEDANEIRQRTLKRVLEQTDLLKPKLHAILDTCQTPELLAAGIYYLNEIYLGQIQSEQISAYTIRLPESEVILYRNLKNKNLATIKSKVGLTLPDSKLVTPKGKYYSLYQIRGTYKVIAWWASWCGPCRKANTGQLPVLYPKLSRYHIPIIGISIDKDLSKWKEAVKRDNTPWLQTIEVEPLLGNLVQADMVVVPLYLVLDENNLVVHEARSPAQIEFYFKDRIPDF